MKDTRHSSTNGGSYALWGLLIVSAALSAAACAGDAQNDDDMQTSDAPQPSAPVPDTPSSTEVEPTPNDGPTANTEPEVPNSNEPRDTEETPSDPAQCPDAGGVCVPFGACEQQGGTVAGTSDCEFDDGAAECCVPPEPQPGGTTCEDAGGICTSVGGCLQSDGYIALPDVACEGGAGVACCVAHEVCGDADIDCCRDGAIFRPACDNGELVCAVGDPYPVGACPN